MWNPHHRYLIDDIERIQKRFTKAIPALKNLPYAVRLKTLNLPSLQHRRLISDLCLCYSFLNGFIDSDLKHSFQFSMYHSTRGHQFKLKSVFNRVDVTKFFYTNRIINIWNQLPSDIVSLTTFSSFTNLVAGVNIQMLI